MMTVGPFLTREAAEARASSYEARGYSCEIVEAPGVISGPFSLRCALATPDPLLKPRKAPRRRNRRIEQ